MSYYCASYLLSDIHHSVEAEGAELRLDSNGYRHQKNNQENTQITYLSNEAEGAILSREKTRLKAQKKQSEVGPSGVQAYKFIGSL